MGIFVFHLSFLKGVFSKFYIFPKDNNILLSILFGLSKASLSAAQESPEHPDQTNVNNYKLFTDFFPKSILLGCGNPTSVLQHIAFLLSPQKS